MGATNVSKLWALREAAKTNGFTPNAASVRGYLSYLEMRGLVRQSNVGLFWMITERGRTELQRLEAELHAANQQLVANTETKSDT